MKRVLLENTLGKTLLLRMQASPGLPVIRFGLDDPTRILSIREVLYSAENLYRNIRKICSSNSIVLAEIPKCAFILEDKSSLLIGICAVQGLHGITIPVYPNLPVAEILRLLERSEAEILFTDSKEVAEALESRKPAKLKLMITAGGCPPTGSKSLQNLVFEECLNSRGLDDLSSDFDKRLESQSPDDLAAMLYTSGTSGDPKGVCLTHRNFASVYRDCYQSFHTFIVPESERLLSYLPAAHVLGLIELLGIFSFGWQIHAVSPKSDLTVGLKKVKPTILFSTPRLFEKIAQAMHQRSSEKSLLKRWILTYSLDILTKKPNRWNPTTLYIRARLRAGLGNALKFAICGGAHLSPQVVDFFYNLGLPIYEGYGLTETTGPISVNRPGAFKSGTVGKPFPEVEVKIAPDGEVLVRSEKLFKRYDQMPQETHEAFVDGWFLTGDLGFLDPDGFLHIYDRKKDLLVLSGGKNVAPQKIESLLKAQSEMISDAYVIGDQRPFISAIISIKPEHVKSLGEQLGHMVADPKLLVKDPEFLKLMEEIIARANAQLAPYEHIRRFLVLPYAFTLETGELTPTLKVKRFAIARKLIHEIESLYS